MSNPMNILQNKDARHGEMIEQYRQLALGPGALDTKTKLLIALALDALAKAEDGVAALSKMAKSEGATEDEMLEAIRVAGYIGAATTVFPAMCGVAKCE